jgi:lipopolysaccharide/colanic/teichoic acid biosynthesis glycosyltransferase
MAARSLVRQQNLALASNMSAVPQAEAIRLVARRSTSSAPAAAIERPTPTSRSASEGYASFRRILDVMAAVVALAVFAVFLPLIALAIKLDSRGPIFYTQDRVGVDRRRRPGSNCAGPERRKVIQPGRPFRIFKLRTMTVDAEANGPQWATKDDQRITRVGRFLRSTRLDEIPQFLNVLRGEMTLIGPRPERLCFVHKFVGSIPCYRDRLQTLPGITGLAQVINGYDDSPESVRRKIQLDRLYIFNACPALDLRILLATCKLVLTGGKTSNLDYPLA